MKFKQTITLNCLECNFDQTVVYTTFWRRILLSFNIPIKEYCPLCEEITEHLEIDDYQEEE